MIEPIAVAVSLFASFVLALFILLKNPRSANYILFFCLILSLIAFSGVNYISIDPILLNQLLWIRLDAIAGAFVFLFTYLTLDNFPLSVYKKKAYRHSLAVTATVLLSILALSPLIFARLDIIAGKAQPVPGPAIPLLLIHHASLMVFTTVISIRKYRLADRVHRNQLRIILIGLVTALTSIIVFNLVFVQVLNNTSFTFKLFWYFGV